MYIHNTLRIIISHYMYRYLYTSEIFYRVCSMWREALRAEQGRLRGETGEDASRKRAQMREARGL